jgi:hypothetical protein
MQLRSGRSQFYVSLLLKSSNRGWHSEWFYIKNDSASLHKFTRQALVPGDHWGWGPDKLEKKKVELILCEVQELKRSLVTGPGLCWTFFSLRIQPPKARAHPIWEYSSCNTSGVTMRDFK